MDKSVRSLSRGLSVLSALNGANFSNASQIARLTGLPRPTVYRLLKTLVAEGYVTHLPDEDVFSVRRQVRDLSSGLDSAALATDLSRPLAEALSDQIVWPIDILIFDGAGMRVRHSTHGRSPRSLLLRSSIGVSLPLTRTAPGRIYLAKLPADEREWAVEQALEREQASDGADRGTVVRDLIKRVGELGYGYRDGGVLPKTTSIAVPVCHQGRPVACISAMFMRSAVPLQSAVDLYLQPMLKISEQVEAEMLAA